MVKYPANLNITDFSSVYNRRVIIDGINIGISCRASKNFLLNQLSDVVLILSNLLAAIRLVS